MADRILHLLPPSNRRGTPAAVALPPCRRPGCAAPAGGDLGFCVGCRACYEASAARRWRCVEVVCARLAAAGDPLFAVFSGRSRDLGAHVVAHLEELDADRLHVPSAAIRDYLAELDELARRSA